MVRIAALFAATVVASCGITAPDDASCFVGTYTRHEGDQRPLKMVTASDDRWCTFGGSASMEQAPSLSSAVAF
jgi:hypothetical protein